jgi:hypothetical protein
MRRHWAVEFAINLPQSYWLRINNYDLKGRASDIDISSTIAIIRGIDFHQVVFHSIWEEFKVINLIIMKDATNRKLLILPPQNEKNRFIRALLREIRPREVAF